MNSSKTFTPARLIYFRILNLFFKRTRTLNTELACTIGLKLITVNLIFQSLFRLNSDCPYLVHFTSKITYPKNLNVTGSLENSRFLLSLAVSPSLYLQCINGVNVDSSCLIGPKVTIVSANHDPLNIDYHIQDRPIAIEKDVWICAGAVILPASVVPIGTVVGANQKYKSKSQGS